MKRRHRLAEILLDILPYDGNPHETACRLEHAIDDDMEVALSRLITPDKRPQRTRYSPTYARHCRTPFQEFFIRLVNGS